MADSKLRLQIITALDNAGIKATQNQLKSLESDLSRINNSNNSSLEAFDKRLVQLPGKLGKVAEGFGKIGKAMGLIGLFVAVFQEGREIGEKIREWVGETWDWAKTFNQVQAEIARTEQMLEDAHKQEVEMIKLVGSKKEEMANKEDQRYAKSLNNINNQTKALVSQVKTIQDIQSAKDNAEVLQLERMKFEESAKYRINGDNDIADQIEKTYDVYIAEVKLAQELEAFDIESAKRRKIAIQDEERFLNIMKNQAKAEEALAREQTKLEQIGKTTRGEKYLEQQKIVQRAQDRADRLLQKAQDMSLKISENSALETQRELSRSNIESQAMLGIDTMARDIDTDMLVQNGLLTQQTVSAWSKMLLDMSNQVWNNQNRALNNNDWTALGDLLKQLLELKQ